MTLLCAAALGDIPGVRPCAEWGLHRVSCEDHDGYTRKPGRCAGCLPKSADRGLLCAAHFDEVEAAVIEWPRWLRLIEAADGRTVSPSGDSTGQPLGYSLLPLAYLEVDACQRFLASQGDQPLDVWIATEEGARDAIQFALAAKRAYHALEVEERPTKFERVRCPECGLLSLHENPTRELRGSTVVTCQHCGHQLATVKTPAPRWIGSDICNVGRHGDCDRVTCECACHEGDLFDADRSMLGWTRRDVWEVTQDGRFHEIARAAA